MRVTLFFVVLALSCACYAANPPICPHVIGWNSSIATWAQGAPWIKVIYSGDVAPAKATGAKVFYRPWDADSANHDDACLPTSLTGSQYADLVWAKLSTMSPKPDAVSYRNEFNWDNPTCSKRTCAEFVNYASRLKTLGYTGKVIFSSFGVGWVDDGTWNDPDVIAAVNASDGIETHEYFDLQVNCGAPWLCFRHRDIALANHPYLQSKQWYIGEFGSDRCCGSSGSCGDPQCRRGWRDNGKLTEQAYINEMTTYRAGCASQVVAVFVFQQGDTGPWADFEVMGTSVGAYMRTTWGLSTGRFIGSVKDTAGKGIPYATVTITPGNTTVQGSSGGSYITPYVTIGTYDITASKTGYAQQTLFGKTVSAGTSTGASFTLTPLTPIGSAKKQADATTAAISGIVTAQFSDRIYVEDPARTSGIAVLPTGAASLTDLVQAQGTVYTTADGERVIKDASVIALQSGGSMPRALAMRNLWLGGGQFGSQGPVLDKNTITAYATGLSNVGLLVHAWGKVSFIDPAKAFFYVDDGSGIDDGSGHAGVRVACSGLPTPTSGAYVDVAGVSSTAMIGGKVVRLVRPRSMGDLSYATASNYLLNPGFESGSMTGWTPYGRTDGAQSGTWFTGITSHSGSWFFGNAANWDTKVGGVYQRVSAAVGGSYQARAWSRVYWSGNSSDSVKSRIGIDPTGGTNAAASTVVWSPTDTQPTSDYSRWTQLTTPTATCTSGLVTIFLDFTQTNSANWHINCFDDAEVVLVR